jgi:hypothetical protein
LTVSIIAGPDIWIVATSLTAAGLLGIGYFALFRVRPETQSGPSGDVHRVGDRPRRGTNVSVRCDGVDEPRYEPSDRGTLPRN